MQFIRTIQKAPNGTIVLELPAELADEEVEVIVLPMRTQSELLTPVGKLDSERDDALYSQTRQRLRKGRNSNEPRILGLTGGIVKMSGDFNAPLSVE